jgi:hypothetical protein
MKTMTIVSKHSLIFITALLIVTSFPFIGVAGIVNGTLKGLELKVISLVMAVILPTFLLTLITSRYTVTRKGVATRSIWRSRQIMWNEVKALKLVPTYFQVFNIQIILCSSNRHVGLLTAFMSNRNELHKAIIEAARASNPNVELNDWVIHEYGQPPYGIFSMQRLNSRR